MNIPKENLAHAKLLGLLMDNDENGSAHAAENLGRWVEHEIDTALKWERKSIFQELQDASHLTLAESGELEGGYVDWKNICEIFDELFEIDAK